MTGLIRAELLKLWRRPLAWILLGLVPCIVLIFYALIFAVVAGLEGGSANTAELEAALDARNAVTFSDAIVLRVTALLAVIIAGAMAGGEFSWRTAVPMALWAPRRAWLLPARIAALATWAVAAVTLGFACALAAVLTGGTLGGQAGPLLAQLTGALIGVSLGVMVYALLATALGLLLRSSAGAIALTVIIVLVEPLGAGAFREAGGGLAIVANATLAFNVDGLLAANGEVVGRSEDLGAYPPAWRAALFLVGFALFTGWLANAINLRRDVD